MEAIEKKSSQWKSVATNIAAVATAAGVIMGLYYNHQKHLEEREADRAEKIMVETIEKAGLLTSAEFIAYTKKQDVHRTNVEAFTLDYMASVDSALLIVLPTLADADRAILKRLALIETKVDAQAQPDTETALNRVWKYLEKQAARDSTEQRHREIMGLLRKMNSEKLKARDGDRIE